MLHTRPLIPINQQERSIAKTHDAIIPRQDVDGKWGFTDFDDNTIIPFIYADAQHNFFEQDDLVAVKDFVYRKYGFINTHGELIIDFQFEATKYFHNGYCPVKIGAKWGVIDITGDLVIEPQYDYISCFDNELDELVADAVLDGFMGKIDPTNKVLLPFWN